MLLIKKNGRTDDCIMFMVAKIVFLSFMSECSCEMSDIYRSSVYRVADIIVYDLQVSLMSQVWLEVQQKLRLLQEREEERRRGAELNSLLNLRISRCVR